MVCFLVKKHELLLLDIKVDATVKQILDRGKNLKPRAKKICVLIGQPKALAYAIRNLTVINRNTKLKERLRGEIEANNDFGLHISSRYILPEEQPMMAAEPEPNPDIRSNIK